MALGSVPNVIMPHFDSVCFLRLDHSQGPSQMYFLTSFLVSEVDESIANTYQLAVSDFNHRNIGLHKGSSMLHNIMHPADTDALISLMKSSFHYILLDPLLIVLDKVFDVVVDILDFSGQSSTIILLRVDFVLAQLKVPLSNTIRYVELLVVKLIVTIH